MPPKRTKSGVGSAQGQKWEQSLLTTPFVEEGKWTATLALVQGNLLEDYENIKVLSEAVNAGQRRLFSIITKDDLYEQVNDLGNPKNKKAKEVPANFEICESVKVYLDNDEEIPLPLLAKLIKFRLLSIKTKDLQRRDAEAKAAAARKGGKAAERSKSPAKGGKGAAKAKTPEPPSPKMDSKLRKRGEEDTDSKFIDDEPEDGPEHFILVSGFHNPHLPAHLADLNIYFDCCIRMFSEDYERFHVEAPEAAEQAPITDDKILAEELAQKRKEREREELVQYWKDMCLVLVKAPENSRLHDLARLSYTVQSSIIPANMEDAEKKMEFGTAMFEDIAVMVYDMLDAKRQWKNFLEHLKLLHVPTLAEGIPSSNADSQSQQSPTPAPAAVPGATDGIEAKPVSEIDMRYYSELMNCIPQESVSVPLVMHCMLEQICATEEDRDPPSEQTRPPRSDGLEETLAAHISEMTSKLALSDEEQQTLKDEFDTSKHLSYKTHQPQMINHADTSKRNLHHLQTIEGFNPLEAETEMLKLLPMSHLHELPHHSEKVANERAARLQELLHFCATDTLTQSEIDRAFKQFVFECMELSSEEKEDVKSRRQCKSRSAMPWDDPYPVHKAQLLNFKEEDLEEAENIKRGKKSSKAASQAPPPEPEPVPVLPDSRPSSGILKSPARQSSTSSRKSSVHWERDEEGDLVIQPGDDASSNASSTSSSEGEGSDLIVKSQKRNLDQWCFMEQFEPAVLKQVLKAASATLPMMDTYYHRRDHSLFVALHNPHGQQLSSRVTWETSLHSNVGFRNYMEFVADSIEEWTNQEEAKYQASLLAKEVENIAKEAQEAASRPASVNKKDRSKSPKKSASRAGRSSSRGSSTERAPGAPFIRDGSLKAMKGDLDRARAEEEEKERDKAEKRAKSAAKKAASTESEKKKPGSRASSRSRMSKDAVDEPEQAEKKEENLMPPPPKPEGVSTHQPPPKPEGVSTHQFSGYDMGNQMLHAAGEITTLFPADGGHIRTEKTAFLQSTISVRTTVVKDNHVYVVHVLDPKAEAEEQPDDTEIPDEPEKAELEKSEKEEGEERVGSAASKPVAAPKPKTPTVGHFGSLSAQFADGMSIALSVYGDEGVCADGMRYEPKAYTMPPLRTPTPSPASPSKGKGKDKGKTGATPEPPAPDEEEVKEEPIPEEPIPEQTFQTINLTSPDGLRVQFMLESHLGIRPESEDERRLVVKQSYPFKTKGNQPCEAARKVAMDEISRTITSDGTVVKYMENGNVLVLYADGKVTEFRNYPLGSAERAASPQRVGSAKSDRDTPTKKGKGKKGAAADVSEAVPEDLSKKGRVVTTMPSGERISTLVDGVQEETKRALVCVASDPQTKQKNLDWDEIVREVTRTRILAMNTREDHVVTVYHPDGSTIVEHSDGTRISTYIQKVQQECPNEDQGENTNENKEMKLIYVECPGYALVKFDGTSIQCQTEFGSGTIVHTHASGNYDIFYHDGTYLQLNSDGSTVLFPRTNNELEQHDPDTQLQYILRHYAPQILYAIDNEGNEFSVTNTGETAIRLASGDELTDAEGEKTDNMQENVHMKRVVHYKQHAPRFFIIHPDGTGKELLRYQDVAQYISSAENDASTAILMDPLIDCQGVLGITMLKPIQQTVSQQWLRPYVMDTIIPPGLTSRDLKTLPPSEQKKPGPKFGTKVGQALDVGNRPVPQPQPQSLKCPSKLELRNLIQYKPVSDELREKLKERLRKHAEHVMQRNSQSEHLQEMVAGDINKASAVKPVKSPVPSLVLDNKATLEGDIKSVYERATQPYVPSPIQTPTPKRSKTDWERDMREISIEKENKKALKERNVPKYFESELGKSFLLSQAPDLKSLTKDLAKGDPFSSHNSPASPVGSDTSRHSISAPPPYLSNGTTIPVNDRSMSSTPPISNVNVQLTRDSPGIQRDYGTTPSSVRPGNPTPGHALGQGSPAPVRPKNPTPAHATKNVVDRPGAPTPKEACGPASSETPSSHAYPSIPEHPQERACAQPLQSAESERAAPPLSLTTNVIGQPRGQQVPLPSYIRSGRPGATANQKFEMVEDPVRRKTYTSSIAGATDHGSQTLSTMRGFELLPDKVDFGVVKEGNTYSYTAYLKNTGMDACRFKIKQPPPSTGLRVFYRPGPVAAGMKVELNMELYAIAVGVEGENGVGVVGHSLDITTETHQLFLPVRATVLTAQAFDDRAAHEKVGKAAGVKLVSTKPPGGQGIIRPRKQGPGTVSS